jgi:selenocysteine lyase/cysteine desulfurase
VTFDFSTANLDREFPVRRSLVYFNHAAVAPLPRRVADAIAAHVENVRDRGAADWRRWYGGIERAREKTARFLGADATEIAFLPSTSWAINLVARSLDWSRGDNVVGDDMQFPSNSAPWKLLEAQGVEYRATASRGGRISVEDLAARIDARTRVVAVSWVAFHNGFVYPVEAIGRLCRERGILFVVDAIQGLGALPLDVAEAKIDVLAADSHKWLLASECCTVFYVSAAARDRLPPTSAAGGTRRARSRRPVSSALGWSSTRALVATSRVAFRPQQIAGLEAAIDLLGEIGNETVRDRILQSRDGSPGRSRLPWLADLDARAPRLRNPRGRAAVGRRFQDGQGPGAERRYRRPARGRRTFLPARGQRSRRGRAGTSDDRHDRLSDRSTQTA